MKIQRPSKVLGNVVWKVKEDEMVSLGGIIGHIITSTQRYPIISPAAGLFHALNQNDDDAFLCEIFPCPHDLLFSKSTKCVACNDHVSKEEYASYVEVMFNDGQKYHLSTQEAKALDLKTISRQLQDKKLSLVLDLDHTLLHATADHAAKHMRDTDIFDFQLQDRRDGRLMTHFVKLRPGLRNTLTCLSKLYNLYVYTHGTREYALEIAKIIDPENKFFASRIVARDDTPDITHKNLKVRLKMIKTNHH